MKAAALCVILAVAAFAAEAQVFKWVDEKGRTHYGEKPPEGTKATEVAKPVPPSDPARAATPDNWKAREQESRRDGVARKKAESEQEAKAGAERERRCRNARVALDRLENVARLYRYDERGNRVYFTDAEREPEKAQARREVQEHC